MSDCPEPRLWTGPNLASGTPVRCVVLVVHGGKPDSRAPSRPWHLSGLRMWQFTWAIRRAGRQHGVLAVQLQNRFRGWNGAERSPVEDARWALRRIHRDHPGTPVVVVGHSMGGRTAAAVADDPQVIGIVALAPWWPDGGELGTVRVDQTIRVLHGRSDSWTDPMKSRREVEAAKSRGVDARYIEMPGGHFMIRCARSWVRTATESVMDVAEHLRPRGSRPRNVCSEDNGVTA
ncbi:alpha/beta fold hydrolase [Rhodococcus sp. G-MC3]|uniref:alpha/beta fold hydrolase n=1 Tax=Rhodococcus sp. G-MC3 TaxID=3046209 RepID=UPI0024BB2BD1|nr:alpha/beta fold hydrolase [Rhodococcus sp. G-MC3]MDJ0392051.1 alpha/beta fold hydrolase [Rhodococcus sp. G-MC3]